MRRKSTPPFCIRYPLTSIKSVCDCKFPFLSYDSVLTTPIPFAYHSMFLVCILKPMAKEFASLDNLNKIC